MFSQAQGLCKAVNKIPLELLNLDWLKKINTHGSDTAVNTLVTVTAEMRRRGIL